MRRTWQCAAFALAMSFGAVGCSSSQEDEEKMTPDGGDEAATNEPEAPTEEAPAVAEAPAPAPAPEAAPLPAAVAPAPAAPAAAIDKGRVVRYVSADELTILAQPKDGAPVVGKLVKGDRVLIVEESGWGRVADGMYVKLDALSAKGVARSFEPAQWIPPAH